LFNFVALSLTQMLALSAILGTEEPLTDGQRGKLEWTLKVQKITELLFVNAKTHKLH
jgi:hypothetical protein